jgi:hypothetical protein
MYILDRDDMKSEPKYVQIGGCYCGPSFFVGDDDWGRVVSSGGNKLQIWRVDATKSPPLVPEGAASLTSGQDGGFFTSVSSNGKDTAIIWAVSRPTQTDNQVFLHAFKASSGSLPDLLPGGLSAGNWPNVGGNTNIVPTVANGKVYVASNKQLQIFGLSVTGPLMSGFLSEPSAVAQAESLGVSAVPPSGPMYWGILKRIDGDLLLVELRTGRVLQVDITQAVKEQQATRVNVGQAVAVSGVMNANGIFEANILLRAKGRSTWGADSPQQ